MNIRDVNDLQTMLEYFQEKLEWNIEFDDEEFDADSYSYSVSSEELDIKQEEFAKIKDCRQLKPIIDNMPFGIFVVEFESKKLEVAALRKILSKLISKKRNNSDFPTWNCDELIFLCFWGNENDRYIGVACFDDKDKKLPQLKIEYIQPKNEESTQIEHFEKKLSHLKIPANIEDTVAWKEEWSHTFTSVYKQQIKDSKTLAIRLANIAKNVRKSIVDTYGVENKYGYVHLLFDKFKDKLVHDLTVEEFADMYAQTLCYGLFSAKSMDTSEHFEWEKAINDIPNTNPFLKALIKSCFINENGSSSFFDELEINKIIDLLDNTDINAILENWNRQTGNGKEDTVVYFYEDFLNEYEHETKKRRGVYYTPQPVVNFIVRAVDSILKTEFGLADGLASEQTKTVKYMREKIRGQGMTEDTKEVPAVQILDPATGTGTFLRQTILQIYDNFKLKHNGESKESITKAWNLYVDNNLLPRLNGFELMMAPYAVAHMKLAMVLKDTGYDFSGNHRLNVFLTNSLEEAGKDDFQMTLFDNDPLAFESIEANKAKKNNGINVIIGNPPYSGVSSNNNDYIANLINDYKYIDGVYFNERKHWLNDDYVKFIRYAQSLIEHTGSGILAYICPHGFLDNPTFRAMRWNLLQSFDKIYILNLHGNVNRGEKCPDGSKDENVFDIEQGVSINIFIKNQKSTSRSMIYHNDLYGMRELKYQFLQSKSISDISWANVEVNSPYYLFVPNSISEANYYWEWININELFIKNTTGIVTMGDEFIVADTAESVESRIKDFLATNYTPSSFKEKYHLGKNYPDFALSNKKLVEYNSNKIIKLCYRPFDNKYTYYDRLLLWRARDDVSPMFSIGYNVGLITARSNKADDCSHFFISDCMSEAKCGERTTQSSIFPLFSYSFDATVNKIVRTPNLKKSIIEKIAVSLNLSFSPDSQSGNRHCFVPIDLLDYIYAVVYSSKYRKRYKEFLKIDFPRVPYPTDQEIFWKLVEIGGKLRECHLMQTEFDTAPYSFIGDGTNEVVKPEYKNGRVYINKDQYFEGVTDLAWNFYIGGYQPCQKWLKDRKGKKLTDEDIIHYQKIVVALTETDKLMKEIDEVFEF